MEQWAHTVQHLEDLVGARTEQLQVQQRRRNELQNQLQEQQGYQGDLDLELLALESEYAERAREVAGLKANLRPPTQNGSSASSTAAGCYTACGVGAGAGAIHGADAVTAWPLQMQLAAAATGPLPRSAVTWRRRVDEVCSIKERMLRTVAREEEQIKAFQSLIAERGAARQRESDTLQQRLEILEARATQEEQAGEKALMESRQAELDRQVSDLRAACGELTRQLQHSRERHASLQRQTAGERQKASALASALEKSQGTSSLEQRRGEAESRLEQALEAQREGEGRLAEARRRYASREAEHAHLVERAVSLQRTLLGMTEAV